MLNNFLSHHSFAFGIEDVGYLVTGSTPQNGGTTDFFSYNPDTDIWSQKDDFPGPARGFSIGVTHKGKAYMGFGLTQAAICVTYGFTMLSLTIGQPCPHALAVVALTQHS